MRNFVLLTLAFIVIFALCMQVDGGLKDLPEDKPSEVTHNESSGGVKELPEHSPATLDEDFIGKYIDTNDFNAAVTSTQNGHNSTSADFNSTKSTVKSDYNSTKNEVDAVSNSFPSDLNNKKTEMEENIAEDEAELDEIKDSWEDEEEDTTE